MCAHQLVKELVERLCALTRTDEIVWRAWSPPDDEEGEWSYYYTFYDGHRYAVMERGACRALSIDDAGFIEFHPHIPTEAHLAALLGELEGAIGRRRAS